MKRNLKLQILKDKKMNKLTVYLSTLHYEDYEKLLLCYLPKSFISKRILIRFISIVYFKAKKVNYAKYLDPHEWLENEIEEFWGQFGMLLE